MKIEKIMLPTDLDDDVRATFPWAAALARASDAGVVLFHGVDLAAMGRYGDHILGPNSAQVIEDAVRFAEDRMASLAADESLSELEVVRLTRPAEDVTTCILETAEEQGADMLILPTRTKPGLRRLVMGSVAEQVMRSANIPVLLHHLTGEDTSASPEMKRILATTDLSAEADASAEYVTHLARAFGSKVDVLHVLEENLPAGFELAGIHDIFELRPDLEKKLRLQLEDRAGRTLEGVDYEVHLLSGPPAYRITHFARDSGVDLIVMASRGHDTIGDRFFGSTADRVVRTAHCPVWVVHPPEGEAR